MLDKTAIEKFIEEKLAGTDMYLVDLEISPDNVIRVELDSDTSVDIDSCVKLTREIEEEFDRDKEDYELEVGSAGLTSPLRVSRQYQKYLGKELEVLTLSGEKLKGELVSANDEGFTISCPTKIKKEGSKRPVIENVDHTIGYGEVKQAKYLLKF